MLVRQKSWAYVSCPEVAMPVTYLVAVQDGYMLVTMESLCVDEVHLTPEHCAGLRLCETLRYVANCLHVVMFVQNLPTRGPPLQDLSSLIG